MKQINKNKTLLLIIIAVIFTTISMSGSTYALYVNKDTGGTDTYKTGQLDLTLSEDTTLTLVNTFPISDEEGMATTPYNLTITNTGNLTYTFNLLLLSTTASNQIDNQYIKIMVDDETPSTLSSSNILSSNITLIPGQSKKIKIRVWLDYNTPNTQLGKTFSAKVTTNGYAVYTTGNEVIPTLATTVMALSQGDTWETGASGVYATNSYDDNGTTKYHEYRYIGAEVNNWVKFNNDMYRIIGVFDSNSHGIEGKYLVKLIAANILGGYSYGVSNSSNTSGTYSNYTSDWTGNTTLVKANLNILLNDYFYNKTNTSATYGACSNWTYYGGDTDYRTNDCSNIAGYGIDSSLRNYIETATWYLYGTGSNLSKQNMYLCERGGNSCTSGNNGAYAINTSAPVGLMYLSDYLYGSGYYASSDTTTSGASYFGNKNWLYQGYEWTITPCSTNSRRVWFVISGNAGGYSACNPSGARPSFYLKSDISLGGGIGTFSNPYVLE